MVGIFSRFSVNRTGHRRTQSALDQREIVPPNAETATAATGADSAAAATAVTHGIEVAVEFKPVEHPTEPLDNDQPVQCPLPEPSILNDGRIWKERASASVRRRAADLPIMKEGREVATTNPPPQPPQSSRLILPSLSAPENNILNMLEECNAS